MPARWGPFTSTIGLADARIYAEQKMGHPGRGFLKTFVRRRGRLRSTIDFMNSGDVAVLRLFQFWRFAPNRRAALPDRDSSALEASSSHPSLAQKRRSLGTPALTPVCAKAAQSGDPSSHPSLRKSGAVWGPRLAAQAGLAAYGERAYFFTPLVSRPFWWRTRPVISPLSFLVNSTCASTIL